MNARDRLTIALYQPDIPGNTGAIMRLALTGELLLDERERYGRDTSVRFRSDAE